MAEVRDPEAIISASEEEEEEAPAPPKEDEERDRRRREKMKKKLLKEAKKAKRKGVCYLSRIPPKMDDTNLRHLLSSYAEILRIYLVPQDPEALKRRKRSGSFKGQQYTEGWVEFADKRIAKRVAEMLNGEQIGGKRRSPFFYDIWNIKYLSKFKWDDLTEEIAFKKAVREQKLHLELSAAKKERDFYLSKVEKSRALSEIEQRMMKKRKAQDEVEADSQEPVEELRPKVVRQFHQKQPLVEKVEGSKPKLSKDLLAQVFNSGNDRALNHQPLFQV